MHIHTQNDKLRTPTWLARTKKDKNMQEPGMSIPKYINEHKESKRTRNRIYDLQESFLYNT